MCDEPSYGQYAEWDGLIEELHAEQERIAAESSTGAITRETIWVTKDRQRIPIKDMADSHLLNCLRVLVGKSPHGTTFKCDPVMRRELLNVMCNEAYRRKLNVEAYVQQPTTTD